MSRQKSPSLLRVAGVVLRGQRVFRCHYICNDCTDTGSEWVDEMLCQSHSWCPACDTRAEPYLVEEIYVERPEFDDLGDGLDKAMEAMAEANKAMEECLQEMVAFRKRRGL